MQPDPPTIVIVDDASEVRLLVKARLRLSGMLRVVGEGADGAEAIALAREHKPELMLLDVSMPGIDGIEALEQVRTVSPDTLVVLYSGFEEQGLVEKAEELGAAAFIEKSAPIDALVDRLLAIAAQRSAPGAVDQEHPAAPVSEADRRALSADQGVLDEHLERFREVFEEAAIGMATMTLSGHLVRANRALAALMHRGAADLVGVFYGELTDGRGDQITTILEDIRQRPLDIALLEHGLGDAAAERHVRATLAPVRDSAGRPLYLFLQVQDVTAERAAIEELRKSEERFRLLVAVVEDYAIFMLDPSGHIVSWNSGAERSKGYRAGEIIGQHFSVFYPPEVRERKHPEYELEVALREGHYEEEGWRLRKDGSRFWASVLITAVFNERGEHIGFAKVTRDTSERRRLEQEREHALDALAEANAELEALNDRLHQVAQDQSQFLAVTAHELRTPVGVLAGSADMLSQHWRELTDGDRGELLEAMGMSSARLRRLLEDLLTASRLERSALEMSLEHVLVDDLVSDAVTRSRRTQPDAEILTEVPPGLTVHADRDRLGQALDNLLGNALRHGSPPVRVVAREHDTDIELRVSDAGPGVADVMRSRLFNRFATGRNQGGTGLGLFIVRELARAQGGDATYEPPSAAAPSGTFVITVPTNAREPA